MILSISTGQSFSESLFCLPFLKMCNLNWKSTCNTARHFLLFIKYWNKETFSRLLTCTFKLIKLSHANFSITFYVKQCCCRFYLSYTKTKFRLFSKITSAFSQNFFQALKNLWDSKKRYFFGKSFHCFVTARLRQVSWTDDFSQLSNFCC